MLGYSLAFMPFSRLCGKCQLGLRYVSTIHKLERAFISLKVLPINADYYNETHLVGTEKVFLSIKLLQVHYCLL